jgi:hypothetical protein
VLALRPVSEYALVEGVPIWVNEVQEAPEQRSTLYPVTPTLSVDAVQVRLMVLEEEADSREIGGSGGRLGVGGLRGRAHHIAPAGEIAGGIVART